MNTMQLRQSKQIEAVIRQMGASWSLASITARLRRWALGIAYALQPKRAHEVVHIAALLVRDWWGRRPVSSETWRRKPNDAAGGLVFISSNLETETLISAYSRGLFPYSHVGPTKWWSPPQRMLLRPDRIKIEKDVRRLLKSERLEISFDRDFRGVMTACAAPRAHKLHLTWISPSIVDAFTSLHAAGYAHSVEIYEGGALVGGLYGVAINNVFFTESQFSSRRNASKVALAALNAHLLEMNFALNDGKAYAPHLERSGFELLDRAVLTDQLKTAPSRPTTTRWKYSREIMLNQFERLG